MELPYGDWVACHYSNNIVRMWLGIRMNLIMRTLVMSLAVMTVFYKGQITAALVGLTLSYISNVAGTLQSIAQRLTSIETDIVAVERVKEYSSEEENQREAAVRTDEKIVKLPVNWPNNGLIEFKNFQTSYRPGHLPNVIKGIDLKIKAGEKVGIVGRTGAGKSTITLSLFRLLEATGGQIFIDGVDISKIGLRDLRERLSIIPQEPLLFAGSLRYNLDPTLESYEDKVAKDKIDEKKKKDKKEPESKKPLLQEINQFTDQNLWQVLEQSNLKPFLSSKKEGLDFQVQENGENVSVGQRQLLCLARALLKNSKILILDEATAAVDPATDNLIQKTIKNEFKNCTMLTVAHRLNTIIDYDKILVLDGGRVAEFDEPGKLLEDKGGIFYSMCRQAGLV